MLKLLTCPRGHFWECAEEAPAQGVLACPQCGAPADTLPLLDLAPADPDRLPPPVVPVEPELFDAAGRPNVAGYEIEEDLGKSATGVRLYRARQVTVNRDVLLEVVVAREDSSQRAWGSLRGEAAALGKLAHPNIVQIHEVGERDRQVFYNAVELVDGPTLAQKVSEKPLPFPQVIRLLELLARALDHAHRRGLLHRHLRPSCVLLQPVDAIKVGPAVDDPGGAVCRLHAGCFIPKLTGFGLTRKPVEGDAIDADLLGDDAGYLSPEQAWGRSKDLAPHTDVYGLGGILYFLLTGRPPFRGPSLPDILDAIQTAELVSPSSRRRVPADLELICRKALARQPRRRYGTAADLADDLRRASLGLPVGARPTSLAGRLGRWVRRHPAASWLLVVCLLGCFSSLFAYNAGTRAVLDAQVRKAVVDQQLAQERMRNDRLQTEINRLKQVQAFHHYKHRIDRAALALERGNRDVVDQILNACPQKNRGFEWHYLQHRSSGGGHCTLAKVDQNITALAIGPRGKQLATVEQPSVLRDEVRPAVVRLWDAAARQPVRTWTGSPGLVQGLAFNPAGTRLAAAGGNLVGSTGELRVWSLEEGAGAQPVGLYRAAHGFAFTDCAYFGDGAWTVVATGNGMLHTVFTADGVFRGRGPFGDRVGRVPGGQRPITRLAASPDGQVAVFTVGQSEVRVYNAQTGARTGLIGGGFAGQDRPGAFFPPGAAQGLRVRAIALDRAGRLAVAWADRRVVLHARGMGAHSVVEHEIKDLPQQVTRLAFSPDTAQPRLAVACADDSVRIYAPGGDAWHEVFTLPGAPASVGLAFSGTGKALATAAPGKVEVWGPVEE